MAYRQGRHARLPGEQHPVGQGHPPQLRVRPHRQQQQAVRGHGRPDQRGHRDHLPGRARRGDGPDAPVQGSLQPADEVQEAVPEREDHDLGGWLDRDRRLLRRRRQPCQLRRLLLADHQRRRQRQPGGHQHLRHLRGRLHQEVRLQRCRHRLRVRDLDEGRGQPAGLDAGQRPARCAGQGLRGADEDAAREPRPGRRRRRQALPALGRGAVVRLPAARHGDLPAGAVPRLRQHHVVRPARRLEQVRRPERLAVRRRQGQRAGVRERVRHRAVRRHRLPEHRLGVPLLPRRDAGRPDQRRSAVLHPRLQERHRWHQRPLGHRRRDHLPGGRRPDRVR